MRTIAPLASLVAVWMTAPLTAQEHLRDADVSTLIVRPTASVVAEHVTLGDVLDFSGADPRLETQLASVALELDAAPPIELTISHARISALLSEHRVNMAWVLLTGAQRCEVRWELPEPLAPDADQAESEAPLFRQADGLPSRTLADALRAFVADEWREAGGTPELAFEVGAQPYLELTTPPFDFSIRTRDRAKLGLREFRVAIRREGRVHANAELAADVRLVRRVLVPRTPLNVGTHVQRSALTFATMTFDDEAQLGFTEAEQVVGQQVKRFVPPGELITASDLEAVDLVERSQAVTVRGGGALNVRLVGTALDNGKYGDRVRVRIGADRKTRRVVSGVVLGVGMVRIDPSAL